MTTFVLIHGAWHGSWCWKKVRRPLQTLGFDVHVPTLTGLGERSHLLAADVNLTTHINDVVNTIRWEELDDVVLCGHSYGGIVATGVAEVVPERIKSLVYIDAFLPENGQALLDTLPPEFAQSVRDLAQMHGGGWMVPPGPANFFEVNEAERAWVDRQCTPQPLASFEEPLAVSERLATIGDIKFVLATEWKGSHFGPFANAARSRGWPVIEIESGHDVMLDVPEKLVEILMACAGHVDVRQRRLAS